MSDLSILLGVLSFVVFFFYLYFSLEPNRRIKKLGNFIPGPRAYPFVGNLLSLGFDSTHFTENIRGLTEKYGPIFRLFIGKDLLVFVSSPEDIETILLECKQLNKTRNFMEAGRSWIGESLLLASGEKWKTNRKRMVPAFHVKILENFMQIFNKNIDLLVEDLNTFLDGPDFKVSEQVAMFALQNVCETTMGVSLDSLRNSSEYPKVSENLTKIFATKLYIPILLNETVWRFHPLKKKEDKFLKFVHSLTDEVIESRKAENRSNELLEKHDEDLAEGQRRRMIFLDLLLNIQKTDPTFDDKQIRDEVSTFIVAGYDTVGSSISFCLYLLSQNRDIQDKIYSEIQDILQGSDRPLEYRDLQGMKYLEQVINETLRIYTTAPLIPRQADRDIKLKRGFVIPSGAEIFLSYLELHNDPNIFPNPSNFDPENFSAEKVKGRHPYSFLPFSAGLRDCIGKRYAMVELKVALFTLIKNFIFLPAAKKEDLILLNEIVLKSQHGINLRIKRR